MYWYWLLYNMNRIESLLPYLQVGGTLYNKRFTIRLLYNLKQLVVTDCYTIKNWIPAPLSSGWRDVDSRPPRHDGSLREFDALFHQVRIYAFNIYLYILYILVHLIIYIFFCLYNVYIIYISMFCYKKIAWKL